MTAKKETVQYDNEIPGIDAVPEYAPEDDAPENDQAKYITHRKVWTDENGVQQSKDVRLNIDTEWPKYAKENNL